jgi:hypothetical protein
MASWFRAAFPNPAPQTSLEGVRVYERRKRSVAPAGNNDSTAEFLTAAPGAAGSDEEAAVKPSRSCTGAAKPQPITTYYGCVSRSGGFRPHPGQPSVPLASMGDGPVTTLMPVCTLRTPDMRPLPAAVSVEDRRVGRRTLRIVTVSDTHEFHSCLALPPGDVLIHSGDILTIDRFSPAAVSNYNLRDFFRWLNAQPHAVKICIAGNHDLQMEKLGRDAVQRLAHPAVYLEDDMVDVCGGLRIFGSPRSSGASGNSAFQDESKWLTALPDTVRVFADVPPAGPAVAVRARQRARAESSDDEEGGAPDAGLWRDVQLVARATLPDAERVDVLITHGAWTAQRIRAFVVDTVRPALHVCGHIHDMHGVYLLGGDVLPRGARGKQAARGGGGALMIPSINAATTRGQPMREWLQAPIVVDYEF